MRNGFSIAKLNNHEKALVNCHNAELNRIFNSRDYPEGDIVLDPFLGSGTTAVVAETLNRRWLGIEKDKKYAASAKKRIRSVIERKRGC